MSKKFLEKIKKKLEQEKTSLEEQLSRFAQKDKKLEGDWDTKFPEMDSDKGSLEDRAEGIEEYERLLPVEYALEKRLSNINLALKKIEKGDYGTCENCQKIISKERLSAAPEARLCLKCPPLQ